MTEAQGLRLRLVAVLAFALGPIPAALAEPLPKDACDTVATEHAKLTESGTPELVKKGPDWVKANLGSDRWQEVARYIGLHEDLLFKCGHDKLKTLPSNEADEASDSKPEPDDPPPLPARKPPIPETFRNRPVPAAASEPAATPPVARPKPKPKLKAKPKVDDAYRPGAKEGAAQQ